jgi:hypothetical protein
MRHLGLVFGVVGALALPGGCSDDGRPSAKDRSVDGPSVVDGGQRREVNVSREAGAQDAFSADYALVCNKIVTTCSTSATWKAYFTPFTEAQCKTVFDCVVKLYSGACLDKLGDLFTCLPTIGSASGCDTTCLAQTQALQSGCLCPASCGVKCGP